MQTTDILSLDASTQDTLYHNELDSEGAVYAMAQQPAPLGGTEVPVTMSSFCPNFDVRVRVTLYFQGDDDNAILTSALIQTLEQLKPNRKIFCNRTRSLRK